MSYQAHFKSFLPFFYADVILFRAKRKHSLVPFHLLELHLVVTLI